MTPEQEHELWVYKQALKLKGLPDPDEKPRYPLFMTDHPDWKDYCRWCGKKGIFVRTAIMCPIGHGFIGGI